MRVFKWTSLFHVDKEPSIVPVWFSLPKLPIHFFKKECLFHVVSCLGRPLFMHAATTSLARPSVARVCVEVDLMQPLPKCVWVGVGTGDSEGFWQVLQPENLPIYCSFCFRQGHDMGGCHVKHPELQAAMQKREPQRQETQAVSFRPKRAGNVGSLTDVGLAGGSVSANLAMPADSSAIADEPTATATAEALGRHSAHPAAAEARDALAGQSGAQAEGALLAPVVEAEKELDQSCDGQEALVVRPSLTSPCTEATGKAGNTLDGQVAATTQYEQDGEESNRTDGLAVGSEGEEEEIQHVERVAGNLSPRSRVVGGQREAGSLVIDIFNLDPLVQQVQAKVHAEGRRMQS
ncbi:uncharacterized protein LOC113769324 [Coffea eugenioides]|uniref:uncharacterized protein LOC113769324 n=1 Tax=Coffea eugenioides TaxID=49369 RepID=UPI000F614699|nr:uncharacterized protein LOC113769324 [Coffea eugenioides]